MRIGVFYLFDPREVLYARTRLNWYRGEATLLQTYYPYYVETCPPRSNSNLIHRNFGADDEQVFFLYETLDMSELLNHLRPTCFCHTERTARWGGQTERHKQTSAELAHYHDMADAH